MNALHGEAVVRHEVNHDFARDTNRLEESFGGYGSESVEGFAQVAGEGDRLHGRDPGARIWGIRAERNAFTAKLSAPAGWPSRVTCFRLAHWANFRKLG